MCFIIKKIFSLNFKTQILLLTCCILLHHMNKRNNSSGQLNPGPRLIYPALICTFLATYYICNLKKKLSIKTKKFMELILRNTLLERTLV